MRGVLCSLAVSFAFASSSNKSIPIDHPTNAINAPVTGAANSSPILPIIDDQRLVIEAQYNEVHTPSDVDVNEIRSLLHQRLKEESSLIQTLAEEVRDVRAASQDPERADEYLRHIGYDFTQNRESASTPRSGSRSRGNSAIEYVSRQVRLTDFWFRPGIDGSLVTKVASGFGRSFDRAKAFREKQAQRLEERALHPIIQPFQRSQEPAYLRKAEPKKSSYTAFTRNIMAIFDVKEKASREMKMAKSRKGALQQLIESIDSASPEDLAKVSASLKAAVSDEEEMY